MTRGSSSRIEALRAALDDAVRARLLRKHAVSALAELPPENQTVNEKRIRRLMRLMRVRRENSPPDCFPNLLTADLPKAQHQQAREGAQDLSLPAGRAADRSAQSGLVRRHHLA